MKITLVINLPSITSPVKAKEYAAQLAEYLVASPVNEECEIQSILSSVAERERGRA